jgi:hypothetical protein
VLLSLAFGAVFLPPAATASVPGNGRAWELVTPSQPTSTRFAGAGPPGPSGDVIGYTTFGVLPNAPSGPVYSVNRAVRGEHGWSNEGVGFHYSTENVKTERTLFPFFPANAPLERAPTLWLSIIPLSSEELPEGDGALYRLHPDGTLSMIAPMGKLEPIEVVFFHGFITGSDDGEDAVFADAEHLLASDTGRTEGSSIYESRGTTLRQVDVDDDGSLLSPCGSSVSRYGGVSDDFRRIYFTSPAPSTACPGPQEVYLREDGDRTVEISASQCTRPDCDAPQSATFEGATPDGSSVFITTTQQLTNDDLDSSSDLYRYDVGDGKLTLLSGGSPSVSGSPLPTIVHPSADGSYVYFYADGRLLADESSEPAGPCLYLADPSGLHFVSPGEPVGNPELIESLVQLSRNGHRALFNTSGAGEAGDTNGVEDVYLYDADSGSLTRLSKGPGAGGGLGGTTYSSQNQELVPTKPFVYRALSEDGRDAFFSTKEALVPEDVNGSMDLYEWDEGRLSLVSSGVGKGELIFDGATPDGSSVFFRTTDTLLPSDRDGGEMDVYAARIGGGFPEGTTTAECEALSCAPAPGRRLERSAPASAAPNKGGIRLLGVRQGKRGPAVLLSVPTPGWVRIAGSRIGAGPQVVLHGRDRAAGAGKVRVSLSLSKALERILARGGLVKIRLEIRQRKLRLTRTIALPGTT